MIEDDDLNPPFPYWWFASVALMLIVLLIAIYVKGK
jgi:hypothetical protein